MIEQKDYIFGPVPSRRLGYSLGVDIVPFKVCTEDCIYCQIGRTTDKTVERKEYAPIEEVFTQLKEKLNKGVQADYITLSGSGEPTLNSRIGELIDKIKSVTDIPVALITNGSTFCDPGVRKECSRADLILPSLDAASQPVFEQINRPKFGMDIQNIIQGLIDLRKEFAGNIWLEVFIVEGINTSEEQVELLKEAIEKINPDKVQLNTAVRPTAESDIIRISEDKLNSIAEKIGYKAEVIADFSRAKLTKEQKKNADDVLTMLQRRPCSLEDISAGLGIHPNHALKFVEQLLADGRVEKENKNGKIFYKSH